MSLKLIPMEPADKSGQKQKHFNPGNKIKKTTPSLEGFGSLKHICLRLVAFINRGSRFTFQQIDDLIVALERSVMSLRKKKQEMMKRKERK